MKNYVNLQGIKTPIIICLRKVQTWLWKLRYIYKIVHKDVFVNSHEQSDIVEDCTNFLNQMKELKSYIVEFSHNSAMKPKVYLSNCAIKDENC